MDKKPKGDQGGPGELKAGSEGLSPGEGLSSRVRERILDEIRQTAAEGGIGEAAVDDLLASLKVEREGITMGSRREHLYHVRIEGVSVEYVVTPDSTVHIHRVNGAELSNLSADRQREIEKLTSRYGTLLALFNDLYTRGELDWKNILLERIDFKQEERQRMAAERRKNQKEK